MGTKATIAVENKKGGVSMISVHYDGYPEYTGKILLENYDSLEFAQGLVEMGDVSELLKTVVETEFFSRDRKEPLNVKRFLNFEMYRITADVLEYNYLFTGGEWQLVKRGNGGAFTLYPLKGFTGFPCEPDSPGPKYPLRMRNDSSIVGW